MTEQLDNQGEARDALSSVVTDYSKRVLSDPRMLGNLVTDLLPDLPRERSLLVTAAEADVAGDLARHVEEHHLDPDTAVQMVSRALSDRRAIDPAASAWVTAAYARALGYNVRSDTPPAASAPAAGFAAPAPPPYSPTVTTYGSGQQTTSPQDEAPGPAGGWPGYSQPQSQPQSQSQSQPQAPAGYPPAPSGYPPTQGPGGGGYPPGGSGGYPPPQGPGGFQPPVASPYGSPAWQQPPTRPVRRRNRWPVFAGAGTAVVVVFVIAAFAGGLFSQPTPKPSSSPTVHPPTTHPSSSPSPSPSPTVTAGVASLTELLPSDLDDPSSQCSAHTPKFTPVGLQQGVLCNDPGLPNGSVEAFQMSSFANYQKSWANFNKWWGFTSYTPGSSCPPTGSNHLQAEGTTTWYDNFFPTRQGQVLECEWTGTGNNPNDPAIAWTFPTENAFIVAWGGANASFSGLQDWWKNSGQPLASPTPVPASS
jgi:hypothetical protein